ncbi:MAG: PAS domain S-box protein [Ignavibacteriales bacterium]|nr:PAS domain S-box protein [Ignavibacteriales bacterium]
MKSGRDNTAIAFHRHGLHLVPILLIVSVFGVLIPPVLHAQHRGPLILTNSQGSYRLGLHLEYLEDKDRSLTIQDVSSLGFAGRFVKSDFEVPNFGITRSAFWVRLKVKNESDKEYRWMLEYPGSGANSIRYYVPREDSTGFTIKTTGSAYPFSSRDVPHRNLVFKAELPFGKETTLYLRVEDDGPVSIPLVLWASEEFGAKDRNELLIIGLLLGVLLIMLVYNLILGVMLRDVGYLSFALFLFALAGMYADGRGINQQYVWPNHPLSLYAGPGFIALAIAALFWFTRSFLVTKTSFPLADRVIRWLLVLLAVDIFMVFTTVWTVPRFVLAFLFLTAVSTLSALAVIAWRRGFRPAVFLLIAWPPVGIGFILYLLARLSVIPSDPITSQMAWAGTVVLVTLWSLALADRITVTTREKDRAKEDLLRGQRDALTLKDAFNAELQHKNRELELAIAEREKTAEALGLSERRYGNLFQSARDAMFTLSLEGTIVTANRTFGEITGWPEEECKGASMEKFLHPKDVAGAVERFRENLAGRFHGPMELRVLSKNGGVTVAEVSITPEIRHGKTVGFLGIARDITARRKFEEQIREAQKMESIGLLAGGVAHDFNNILAAIIGNADLIAGSPDNKEKLERRLHAISSAAQRGADVVRQLLTFARKTDTKMVSLGIGDVIRETTKLLEETLPKTIVVRVDVQPGVPEIIGDWGQLHQVFLNLSVNARDAMPAGGVLSFSSDVVRGEELPEKFQTGDDSAYVRVIIADSGTGIRDELLKNIFDPFFTTKGVGEGTGLGLAVVFAIVQSHRGFIDVRSKVGKGTEFLIYLPVSAPGPENQKEPQVSRMGDVRGNGELILLIEDEILVSDATMEMIEASGYRVLLASDGIEGVETFERHKDEIALVLSDLGLPKLNGIEVFRRIRAIKPNVQFILASGFMQPEEKSALDKAGLEFFIQKPYLASALLRMMRTALNQK